LKRQTPWHISRPHQVKHKHAIVIGAGLAGCCAAYSLAKRGWQVSLLETHPDIAQGASGNPRAVLFPNISVYSSPLTKFMLAAFLYAHDFYKHCLEHWPVGDLSGLIQFPRHGSISDDLANWLLAYPSLGKLVSAEEASCLAGINIHTNALYVPKAGWIDSKALCERLIQSPGIELFVNSSMQSLEYDSGTWNVGGHRAEVVVVANGFQANRFTQTKDLTIQAVRGQMTAVHVHQESAALKLPICGESHVVPYQADTYLIGATFGPDPQDAACYPAEDAANFSKIRHLPVDLHLSNERLFSWAGIRAATLDHLPLVGPVADVKLFAEQFKTLETDAKRWVECKGEAYLQGLYVFAGFGSRGLTSIPLCAEHLASLICNGPVILERSMAQTISPARFIRQSIFRK